MGADGHDDPLDCWPDKFLIAKSFGPKKFDSSASGFLYGLFDWCLKNTDYNDYLLTEADSMFVGKVPTNCPDGFGTFIAGKCPAEWRCGNYWFLHPPFWMNRTRCAQFVEQCVHNISQDDIGNGTPDVFAGIVCEQAGIPIVQQSVYSTNGLDMRMGSKLLEARNAYNTGAWHIHGVKRQDHIDFISGVTAEFPQDVIWE